MFKFTLTVTWLDGRFTTTTKTFEAVSIKAAWVKAKKWKDNCLAVCGTEHGQSVWKENELVLDK